jgi:MarR family transcriptional regulator, transcriptional regulator for hemolysin
MMPIGTDLRHVLEQVSYALTTQMTARRAEVGISPRAYCVLLFALTGDLTQIQLAELASVDKTTMPMKARRLSAGP